MMDTISELCARLSAEPFCMNLAAVTLEEKSRADLVEILNRVVQVVDPTIARDEASVFEFITTLELNPVSYSYGSTLEREEIYGVLLRIVRDPEGLRNRAVVARFCTPLEIPIDVTNADGLAGLTRTYRNLQIEFTNAHSGFLLIESDSKAFYALHEAVQTLDNERRRLAERTSTMKLKRSDDQLFLMLQSSVASLRKQAELSEELNDKSAVYIKLLSSSQRKLAEASSGLEAKQTLFNSSNILEAIRGDVNFSITQIETLRSALTDLSLRQVLTNRILTNNAHLSWTTEFQRSVDSIQEDIVKLRLRAGKQDSEGIIDEKLALTRRQAILTARRREGLEKSVRVEERLFNELSDDFLAQETMFFRLKARDFIPRNSMDQFVTSLREQAAITKNRKPELRGIAGELAILASTEKALEISGEVDITDHRDSGYLQLEDRLTELSQKKSDIDKSKVDTLSAVSELFYTTKSYIDEHRAVLTPMMAELKTHRQELVSKERELERRRVFHFAATHTLSKLQDESVKAHRLASQDVAAIHTKLRETSLNIRQADTEIKLIPNISNCDAVINITQRRGDILKQRAVSVSPGCNDATRQRAQLDFLQNLLSVVQLTAPVLDLATVVVDSLTLN